MAKGKSGSKALTGILCFIFGFLFAVIVEAALIGGGILFLMNADIDKLLSTVGVDNYDEDTGKNIYINTDVDEGGVKKVTDLITALKDIAGKGKDNITIGDLGTLFPIVETYIDGAYSSVADALASYNITEEDLRGIIDEEELVATPVSKLGEFFKESGKGVKVETVMKMAGITVEASPVYLAVAYGNEATLMYSEADGSVSVLYADGFSAGEQEGTYVRDADGQALPAELVAYLVEQTDGGMTLYYDVDENGAAEIAEYDGGSFAPSGREYPLYSAELATPSGGYYYDSEGALVVLDARTIGDLTSEEAMTVESAVRMMRLCDLLGDVSADDAVMAYLVYGVSDVVPVQDGQTVPEGVTHTATYRVIGKDGKPLEDADGAAVTRTAYIETANGVITGAYYFENGQDGLRTDCATSVDEAVGRMDGLKDDVTIGELIPESDGNTVLDALRDSTINSLADDINALSIQELFADEIYGNDGFVPVAANEDDAAENPGSVAFDTEYLYYYFDGEDYVLLDGEITTDTGVGMTTAVKGHLTGSSAYSIAVNVYGTIYTRGPVTGVWSLLLYDDYAAEGASPDVGERTYGINDVAKMQENVTANLKTVSLTGLMELGVIEEDSEPTLNKGLDEFGVPEGTFPGKSTVGELTIGEFIKLVGMIGQSAQP